MKLSVSDMSCEHCKMAITMKLKEIMKEEDFEVSLDKKEVIWKSKIDIEKVKKKISEAGYHPK